MATALIQEWAEKGQWRAIAGFNYQGTYRSSGSWWQVADIHKIALGMRVDFRDYKAV